MTTWIKLHDNFWENPKVLAAGEDAAGLYIQGLCYCSSHLTDGWIPEAALRVLTGRHNARRLAAALVATGLWDAEPGGWQVHDYEEHQRTRAEVDKIRARASRRASIHRNPALKDAIRARDGDRCRYCGRDVDWTNRRGPLGATYDHVIPDGPDSLANLVVACRGCNSGKQSRTPHEAGMELLPTKSEPSTDSVSDQVAVLPDTETDTETENPPTPLVDKIVDGVFAKVLADKQKTEGIRSVDGFRKWWDANEGDGCRTRAQKMVEDYEFLNLGQYVAATMSPVVPHWASSMRRQTA